MITRNFAVAALLAASMAAAPASAQDFDAVEVTVQEVAPGVAVLFGFGGNIGVSHGADGTLLIDDQFAEISDKVEAAVSDIGATPVRYVVNTHWHFDHAGGNVNFGADGATIFAHDNVRIRLQQGGEVGGNITPPAPPEALPIVTFAQGISLHLNGDSIDVMFLGGGHTDGDSIVRWREANVIHTGDLFLNQAGFPFVDVDSGGGIDRLLRSLDMIIAHSDENTVIIPGHGAVGAREDVIAYRAMVGAATDRIRAARDSGMSLQAFIATKPMEDLGFSQGFMNAEGFITNVWRSLSG